MAESNQIYNSLEIVEEMYSRHSEVPIDESEKPILNAQSSVAKDVPYCMRKEV